MTIEAERPDDLCWEKPVPGTGGDHIAIHSHAIEADGISGELYVVAYKYGSGGESWCRAGWVKNQYLAEHPGEPLPDLPKSNVCINGLSVRGIAPLRPLRLRLDYRRPAPKLGLERTGTTPITEDIDQDPSLTSALTAILDRHLRETPMSQGANGWRYLQAMMGAFPLRTYWREREGVVPVYLGARRSLLSLEAVTEQPSFTTIQCVGDYADVRETRNLKERVLAWETFGIPMEEPAMVDWQLNRFSDAAIGLLFAGRRISDLRAISTDVLRIRWASRQNTPSERSTISLGGHDFYLATLADDEIIGFALHRTALPNWNSVVLNRRSPLVEWVCKLVDAAHARTD
jgi:hypothetical protein